MPGIAVHENGDALKGKDDVRSAGKVTDVASEAKPFGMEPMLHQSFQRSVLELQPLHRARPLVRSQMVEPLTIGPKL